MKYLEEYFQPESAKIQIPFSILLIPEHRASLEESESSYPSSSPQLIRSLDHLKVVIFLTTTLSVVPTTGIAEEPFFLLISTQQVAPLLFTPQILPLFKLVLPP